MCGDLMIRLSIFLRKFIAQHKIGLMGIVETHVLMKNKLRIERSVFRNWQVVDNYEHDDSGRTWVAWDPAIINVQIISKFAQAIFVNVEKGDGSSVILTIVYGANSPKGREKLWTEFVNFARSNKKPWTLMGDFNSILIPEEHMGQIGS